MSTSKDAVLRALTECVSTECAVSRDTTLSEAGVSSLLLFDFVNRLERIAGITIPDTEMRPENFQRVGDVVSLVDRCVGR